LWRRASSGVYYAFLKRGRKQFHRSLKTTDKALAKRRLAELRADVGSLVSHDAAAVTFEVLADRWQASVRHTVKESTAARRQRCVKALSPFFAGLTLRNVTTAHCEAWVTKRGYKIAPQTFAHELDTMKAVFDYAKEQGLILRNPAQAIKRKRILPAKIEVPTLDQFRQLVAAIRRSDGRADSQAKAKDGADLVELLAYSGCRLNEACNLRWRDMHFDRTPPCFTVTGGERMTKNYETRTVPMTDALLGLLSRLYAEQKPKPGEAVVKIGSAKKCLGTACRRLGFPRFTHHDFRHFFATTCIEAGVDIPTISKWLGHKDGGALAMKVYGHLRQEHSFAQIKRVQFGSEQPANVVSLKSEAVP
jgi:integrase